MRLNHEKVNLIFLTDDPLRSKYSNFQKNYIEQAARCFMGLNSQFDKYSRTKQLELSIPILKEFDLIIDED